MIKTLTILTGITFLIVMSASFASDCGDVNNGDALNILDIVYLINHIYKSGPEPDCGRTVMDINGNIYQTVIIGEQEWPKTSELPFTAMVTRFSM